MKYIYLVSEVDMWFKDEEDYGYDVAPVRVFSNEEDARYFADSLAKDLCKTLKGKMVDAPLMEGLDGEKDPDLLYRTAAIKYNGLHDWFGNVDSSKYFDIWKVLCDWD